MNLFRNIVYGNTWLNQNCLSGKILGATSVHIYKPIQKNDIIDLIQYDV